MPTHPTYSVRLRIGQQYLESGTAHKPSGVYLNVESLDPLIVQREVWTGRRGQPQEPYDPAALRRLPLLRDPELTTDELREALVGRRIEGIEVEQHGGSWPQGDGDVTLILDDGRRVALSSWGYDAWGMDAYVDPPLEGS